jgi:spore coat polysaccharide biosynthesis protein SpsF
MQLNVGFLITARLKSTRLPKKLLCPVKGKPIFSHMLDRVKLASSVNRIVICTSASDEDRPLADLARENGVEIFFGDPEDVLKRLHDAARNFGFDYVLNITADCPFVDPVYADRIVEAYRRTGADLIRSFGLPHGAFSYGIKPEALARVMEMKNSGQTEVWGKYFTDTDLFDVYDLPIDPAHRKPGLRMTLDYPEDLRFFEAVFDRLYRPDHVFTLDDILGLLDQHPEIVEINRSCAERFLVRFRSQSEIQLKARHSVARAAIIGCGSIGQRHARNLHRLGIDDVVVLRSRQGHHQELPTDLRVRECGSWEELLAGRPDVAVISNPTALHVDTIRRLLPTVRGIFVEKPLAADWTDVEALLREVRHHRTVSFVGYNLRFHPAIQTLLNSLQSGVAGAPICFQCNAGHWLPDWHPYEDYRQAYFARKDLAGGAALTLSHELDLALELMGPAQAITGVFPPSDKLPLEVDVNANLLIHHDNGLVSHVHLDFLQKLYQRRGTVTCENGWIAYDLAAGDVRAQLAGETAARVLWSDARYDANQSYLDELECFIRYVREGRVRHPWDAWRGAESVAVVSAAFESALAFTQHRLPQPMRDAIKR